MSETIFFGLVAVLPSGVKNEVEIQELQGMYDSCMFSVSVL